jgi:hypothetical protein
VNQRSTTSTSSFRTVLALSVLSGMTVAVLGTSGCARAQAKAVPDVPRLDMPEPPPRTVEVIDPEKLPIVPLPEEPVTSTPSRVPRTPPSRTESRPAEPARTDAAAEPARTTAEEPRTDAPTLQTTPVGQDRDMERRVRLLLTQAGTDLSRVDYRTLNADGRTQYDTAKRFISQADDAVRAKNLVFAANLADKAATLAAQLAGR